MNRPKAITLLASIYLCSGMTTFAIIVWQVGDVMQWLTTVSVIQIPVYLFILVPGWLPIVAGIGLWYGKSWGWWATTFCIAYMIARHGLSLWQLLMIAMSDGLSNMVMPRHYFTYGLLIILYSCLLLYFYKRDILVYFALEPVSRWKSMSLLVVWACSVFLVFVMMSQHLRDISVLIQSWLNRNSGG